jgi:hypothetical protein
VEALDAGLLVIGWRCGNLPHLVDDGKQGFVITPGDMSRSRPRCANSPRTSPNAAGWQPQRPACIEPANLGTIRATVFAILAGQP